MTKLFDDPNARDLLESMRFRCIGPTRGGRVVAGAGLLLAWSALPLRLCRLAISSARGPATSGPLPLLEQQLARRICSR